MPPGVVQLIRGLLCGVDRNIGFQPNSFTTRMRGALASTRATASIAMHVALTSAPAPPYCSGMWVAWKPARCQSSHDVLTYRPDPRHLIHRTADHGRTENVPHYQFFIPKQSNTAHRKTAVAEAFTEVHTRITGAPAGYVNCTFVEVEADGIYVGGAVTPFGRMVGIIRRGRSEEVKRQLLTELADAWSTVAQEPLDKLALFLLEIPGHQAMESGELLGEASEDHLLALDH